MKNKTKKMVKRSKIITQKPKAIENPNIFDMKSVTIEYLKTSRKLSKTLRQAKKFFQVNFDSCIPILDTSNLSAQIT